MKKMSLRLTLIFIIFSLQVPHLTGLDYKPLKKGKSIPKKIASQPHGYLIGSLSFEEIPTFLDYHYYFYNLSRPKSRGAVKQSASFAMLKHKLDYTNNESSSTYFLVPLPPGEYSFNEHMLSLSRDGSLYDNSKHFKPKNEYNIPFSIETGKATYVGDIRAKAILGKKRMLGLPRGIEEIKFIGTDRSAEDLNLIIQKYPSLLNNTPIIKQIIPHDLNSIFEGKDHVDTAPKNESHITTKDPQRLYYILKDNVSYGPYSRTDTEAYLSENRLSLNDLAWTDGELDWIPLQELLSKY